MTVRSAEIQAALLHHFPKPEFAVVFEVAQATGFEANRHLDAIAMDLWPSRGLALHGVEIKVSRADWRREKAAPDKAEEIARFCDDFWIAAPKGLVPLEDLPAAWGLLELDGERLLRSKPAVKTTAEAFGRPFVAALLRAASRGLDPGSMDGMLAAERRQISQTAERRIEAEVARRAAQGNRDAAAWARLCDALGGDPMVRLREDEILRAVRLVVRSGAARTWSNLRAVDDVLARASQDLRAALDGLGVEAEAPRKPRKRGAAA